MARYEVILAVRSDHKGQQILGTYKANNDLSYVVVGDIATPGAFDEAFASNPDVQGVIHAASPFHFRATDYESELFQPALNGTLGILRATKRHAPCVKKVIITSSIAAVMNPFSKPSEYSEDSWNPITKEQALIDPVLGYLGSKTFAERAAWDFMQKESPNFDLATINPPAVLGPVIHHLASWNSINTSNQPIANLVQGMWKDEAPPTFTSPWVDVRDVALAHVLALEKTEASGRRFLLHGGFLSHADYISIAQRNFPSLKRKLPQQVKKENLSDPLVDTTPAREVLGLEFRTLEESVTDTIRSLLDLNL